MAVRVMGLCCIIYCFYCVWKGKGSFKEFRTRPCPALCARTLFLFDSFLFLGDGEASFCEKIYFGFIIAITFCYKYVSIALLVSLYESFL